MAQDPKQDPKLKAFDFASDTTKQFITLATAVTAVTISFAKDVLGGVNDQVHTPIFGLGPRTVLGLAWVVYLVSVISGVVTIMALTAELTRASPSIYRRVITVPGTIMTLAFMAATILIVIAAWAALGYHGSTTAVPTSAHASPSPQTVSPVKAGPSSIANTGGGASP